MKYALRLLCLPVDMLALVVVGLLSALNRGAWHKAAGCLIWLPREGTWFARRVPYSVTLGHVIVIHPGHVGSFSTWLHEQRHVWQSEAACVLWALVTLATWSKVMLALWPLAWAFYVISAGVASKLKGREFYRDNVLEQHARGE